MVELRQLKYFVEVAELEHFGKAAESLSIVQPALSRQVKQLEDELNVALFERLPRGVRLTAAGRMLLLRARPLLAEVEQMLTVTKLASQGKTGFLRVGFADGATYSGQVPQIIGSFRKRNPQVELELVPSSSLAQADLLERESIDIGFVYWLPVNKNGILHHELNRERMVLAAARSNKLSEKAFVHLKDLRDSSFIWFKRENGPAYYDLVVSQCNKAGLTLNVVQEASTESTMLSLVSADIGVTFITESARRRKPENVVLLKIKDLHATITLMAMWRADSRNPALKEFLSVVCNSENWLL